jgi:ferredoxin
VSTFRAPTSSTDAMLKIHVNRERCQGHARCIALASELVEANEYGEGRLIDNGTVPADLYGKAYLAKANCPESAIDVEGETV